MLVLFPAVMLFDVALFADVALFDVALFAAVMLFDVALFAEVALFADVMLLADVALFPVVMLFEVALFSPTVELSSSGSSALKRHPCASSRQEVKRVIVVRRRVIISWAP